MSSDNTTSVADRVLLGREHWDVPVQVELRSYLEFIRRMDCQISGLVNRWRRASPPAAGSRWKEPRGVGVKSSSPPKRRPP